MDHASITSSSPITANVCTGCTGGLTASCPPQNPARVTVCLEEHYCPPSLLPEKKLVQDVDLSPPPAERSLCSASPPLEWSFSQAAPLTWYSWELQTPPRWNSSSWEFYGHSMYVFILCMSQCMNSTSLLVLPGCTGASGVPWHCGWPGLLRAHHVCRCYLSFCGSCA